MLTRDENPRDSVREYRVGTNSRSVFDDADPAVVVVVLVVIVFVLVLVVAQKEEREREEGREVETSRCTWSVRRREAH